MREDRSLARSATYAWALPIALGIISALALAACDSEPTPTPVPPTSTPVADATATTPPIPVDTPSPAPTATPVEPAVVPTVPVPGSRSHTFPETGQTVSGLFLDYWESHGGVLLLGYPISGVMGEISPLDGQPYTVQYFERTMLQYHPQNEPAFNVLQAQLGTLRYRDKYPDGAPGQQPNNDPGSVLFQETGKRLGGRFLEFWNANGGLVQHGFPISDEFQEKSDLDGNTYLVQYFERSVLQYHPQNEPPFDVLLAQLGTLRYKEKYSNR